MNGAQRGGKERGDAPAADDGPREGPPRCALHLTLRGSVQGIGFRPALARLATELGLAGWVANSGQGLEVLVAGPAERLAVFVDQCPAVCPAEGQVDAVESRPVPSPQLIGFRINDSGGGDALATRVPPDRVSCPTCLQEVADPTNRRHEYLLTTCSNCGPRYTILTGMPYERFSTTLHRFALCVACRREYENPRDRRYHAQTISCPHCGPEVSNLPPALAALRAGRVIALKGLGGYQLLARADNLNAIGQLRKLKRRPFKPLAVMVADLAEARRYAVVNAAAERQLTSAAGPIVILPMSPDLVHERRAGVNEICPGLNSIGLMLPTSPLHRRVVADVGPVVVSSANQEDDPIAFRDDSDEPCLQDPAIEIIAHNRPIQRPIDDSVVRVVGRQAATVRLARGLAPCPLPLANPLGGQHILAVGGHQKVAIALANGHQAILGPHVGDMESLAARRRFVEHVEDLLDLYGCQPTVVAHDAHPDYFTTRWAHTFATQRGAALVPVQHHLAHAASSLVQPQWGDGPVTAVTWDGSGWGPDGMIWGGEGWHYSGRDAQRRCRLRPLRLPGGAAAIQEPWRIVAGLLDEIRQRDPSFPESIFQPISLETALLRQIQCPRTTSIGRLFDAAAVMILGEEQLPGRRVGYEGHFAALLESACDHQETGYYALPLVPRCGDPALSWEWDWEPLVRQILQEKRQRFPVGTLAMRFHRGLAKALIAFVQQQASTRVTLSGGVFQNHVLVQLLVQELAATGYELALPGLIPVNDGGLAVGQLVVALARTTPA
jgi:hydrogenase maturation protein HypF